MPSLICKSLQAPKALFVVNRILKTHGRILLHYSMTLYNCTVRIALSIAFAGRKVTSGTLTAFVEGAQNLICFMDFNVFFPLY